MPRTHETPTLRLMDKVLADLRELSGPLGAGKFGHLDNPCSPAPVPNVLPDSALGLVCRHLPQSRILHLHDFVYSAFPSLKAPRPWPWRAFSDPGSDA